MDARLKHPFICAVGDPRLRVKRSSFLRFVRYANKLIHPSPERILLSHGEFQSSFLELPRVEFHEKLTDVNPFDGLHRILLIKDDLMNEVNQSGCSIFTKLSHNKSVSVIFLTQNLFHRNIHVRTMILNTHYLVLFENPRNAG
jgi:hypothetical protein